ncbi:MAG: hypothetical protein KG075_01815 [Alphaproteobacteria bacterium]|nr:hypothetical protein [Alphaproteobacteria bacterium]
MKTQLLLFTLLLAASSATAQGASISAKCTLAIDAALQHAKSRHEKVQKSPHAEKIEFENMFLKRYADVTCREFENGFQVIFVVHGYTTMMTGGGYYYEVNPDYTIHVASPQR